MQRPAGVTAVAVLFLLIAGFICGSGVIMLVSPGVLPKIRVFPLIRGLQMGSPYAALLVGALWGLIGWGLFQLRSWSRLAAMTVIIAGAGVLVVRLAMTTSHFHGTLVWGGLELCVRLAVVWYLFRAPVAEQFSKSARTR